ncbi:DUF3592 domain-containing protein [Winogradskya humida]|uniref:DUF3592 domain-containing protein n=1 Tax=Winogradskya humida TaxID=113566 RepID=A0ABQ3ZJP2_9ACTN|nr:DUF3592 domain-containing protein [Actinoplanes humidus]GIE18427.1 hypothetical protein Ahu01nite_015290 [Actinoplanes humidus]
MFGRGTRAATGGALIVEGLAGIDTPGRKRAGLFGSLAILAIGLIFVAAGWFWHSQHVPFPGGGTATGTITGAERSRNNDNHTMYAKVYTFTTAEGREVTVTEPETSSTRPERGKQVTVSYRPNDPEAARIVPEHDWLPYAIIAIGALVAVIGLITFLIRLTTLITGIVLLASSARRRN